MASTHCRTVFGKDGDIELRIDGATIVLVTPAPGAAVLDWRDAEDLVVEVARLRAQLPGTPA